MKSNLFKKLENNIFVLTPILRDSQYYYSCLPYYLFNNVYIFRVTKVYSPKHDYQLYHP